MNALIYRNPLNRLEREAVERGCPYKVDATVALIDDKLIDLEIFYPKKPAHDLVINTLLDFGAKECRLYSISHLRD